MAPDVKHSIPHGEQAKMKTPFCLKLCCGTGHIFNDLFLQMAISFNLVYFIKVAELDGSQAGFILLIALVVNAIFAPIAGYCSDMFTVPLLSRAVGKRKAWHLIGVIIMTIFFPLLHTRCLVCADDSSWTKFAYYLVLMILVNGIAFPTMNVGHLSIISMVAKNPKESVELNVLRTMCTYLSGILAYAVTWIMLGRDSRDKLSPASWKDFTTVHCILVAVGLIFSVIFHIGTKETNEKKPRGAIHTFFIKQGLQIVGIVLMLSPSGEEDADVVLHVADEEMSAEVSNEKTVNENNKATAQGTSTSGTREEKRKSSFPQKIVKACHVVETNERIPKTRKSWLKEPGLYRVGAIVAITQLVVGVGYAYMPFYLTDYLLLEKEAIAYFPLILFVSGLCGTACSRPLERKLKSKWTYCLAASVLIGSAVWIYLISHSIKYLIYTPVILVGLASSTMVAMALTFLTRLIGEDKETAGFVCSVAGFMTKILAGVFYMIAQNFYPTKSEDGEECEECASFARLVYTLTLAIPPSLSLFIVLFFQKSSGRS